MPFIFFSKTLDCLLEGSIFHQKLVYIGLCRRDESLHEMESSVATLFASADQAGVLNADGLVINKVTRQVNSSEQTNGSMWVITMPINVTVSNGQRQRIHMLLELCDVMDLLLLWFCFHMFLFFWPTYIVYSTFKMAWLLKEAEF